MSHNDRLPLCGIIIINPLFQIDGSVSSFQFILQLFSKYIAVVSMSAFNISSFYTIYSSSFPIPKFLMALKISTFLTRFVSISSLKCPSLFTPNGWPGCVRFWILWECSFHLPFLFSWLPRNLPSLSLIGWQNSKDLLKKIQLLAFKWSKQRYAQECLFRHRDHYHNC